MNPKRQFDFWYAVNNTEVIVEPSRHLETFGNTILQYHLVSELMDSVDKVRVREGKMHAHRPQIITPHAYSQTILEGFGDEAHKYVDWLKQHDKELRILQYGYTLKNHSFSEHVATDRIEAVLEKVKAQVKEQSNPYVAVVHGVDDPWDVCLIKLFWDVITKSAPANIKEMESRKLFDDSSGVPRWLRDEIDKAFLQASRNPLLINGLAKMLEKYGLFDEYQDRFFALVKTSKKAKN